jgi:glycosyltransferase involved in cell wall biosynthesis
MNGVQTDLFAPLVENTRLRVRVAAGAAPEEVVFAFLGTVGARKGFDVLAEAFLRICREGLPVQLWVIGPNSPEQNQNLDWEEVKGLLRPLDVVADRVHLWGRVDDRKRLREVLGSSDVFVFPSRREGQGVAPLEAMALELPVVISRLPRITDQAAVEGQSGYYVAPGDTDQLARTMRSLAIDRNLRRSMGVAGRRRVVEHFGWDRHISQWEEIYSGAPFHKPRG